MPSRRPVTRSPQRRMAGSRAQTPMPGVSPQPVMKGLSALMILAQRHSPPLVKARRDAELRPVLHQQPAKAHGVPLTQALLPSQEPLTRSRAVARGTTPVPQHMEEETLALPEPAPLPRWPARVGLRAAAPRPAAPQALAVEVQGRSVQPPRAEAPPLHVRGERPRLFLSRQV